MTRHLASLADIAYRRRGRMVLAWIVATVVLIGLGSTFAGSFHADYNTPGSASTAASEITRAISTATRDRRSTSSGRTQAGRVVGRQERCQGLPHRSRRSRLHRFGDRYPDLQGSDDRDHDAAADDRGVECSEAGWRTADQGGRTQQRGWP